MAVRTCQLLGLGVLLLTGPTSAQSCDYSESAYCIKAEASASVALPFAPLFSTQPTFVFAIGSMDDQDIQDMLSADEFLRPPPDDEPAQAVAWWLEYDNSTVNRDPLQEREYVAWALESNSTNDIGGSDGGCENLLGAECVSDLKALFTGINGDFLPTLKDFFKTPPPRINCPTLVWHHGDGNDPAFGGTAYVKPLSTRGDWFARMRNHRLLHPETSGPPSSGNSSYTHSARRMRFRSFEEQKATAVVAFNMGESLIGGGRDNTTINMACLRVGEAPGQGKVGPPDNAAEANTAAASAVVLGVMAAIWAFVA
ncbi:hypothetical protein N658DRAFT_485826 [Parathielavia hyrcaniae]|uniref:Uncharacterized protein n=1 Tax=Parathielavia hyrcaniae TaxID=113614 RepID=A0AAN6T1T2_9PEZI|nr:hypothetical protein N658DRAFT_485826 [Parathielavia hyrcaniae]